MRLNSKGQITIQAELRKKKHRRRLARGMRGKATTPMSTDELMDLLRGE